MQRVLQTLRPALQRLSMNLGLHCWQWSSKLPQPTTAAMDYAALTSFLNSLESYSSDLVQELRGGVKLCHYTTLDGALGIIQGGDLWLSHLRFSNDDEEFLYGLRLVDEELEAQAIAVPTDVERVARIRAVRALIEKQRDQPIFICCFCEHDNLLSQWRGYADNGGGVSIEFDAQGFRRYSGEDSPFGLTRLWRVVYKDESQRNVVRKALDYPYWPSQEQPDRVRYIADALSFFLPTFKNVDFIDEKERRLIFTPAPVNPPKPRFRVRGGMVVPYMRMRDMAGLPPDAPPRPLPIVRVLVGPGRHRLLNRESLRMALDSHGYSAVPVDVSSTPYRG
jgi:hypothetical protein